MNRATKVSLALLVLVATTPSATVAAQTKVDLIRLYSGPDYTFGGDGEVVASTPSSGQGLDIAIDAAGKLVVGLYYSAGLFQVARYNADGTPDATFGQGGLSASASTSGDVEAVTIHQGKIIAVGTESYSSPTGDRRIKVARFNSNGSLDTTFGGTGYVTITPTGWTRASGRAVAVMPTSGRIIVGGDVHNGSETRFFAARLNASGSLDNSFSTDGMNAFQFPGLQSSFCNDMALQSNGNEDTGFIAFAGDVGPAPQTMGVAVLGLDGEPLTSFSSDGFTTIDFYQGADSAGGIKVDPQGRLVIGGSTQGRLAAARLLLTGAPDINFSVDGKQTITFNGLADMFGTDVLVDANSQVFVVGYGWNSSPHASKAAIGSLDSGGTLNQSFGNYGKTTFDPPAHTWIEVHAAAWDSIGLIVTSGLVAP
jgi:uncharacterized delta-60 repeat protein